MNRLIGWMIALFLLVGVFAPVLANSVPIVASVNGTLHFPAVATFIGEPEPGPDGLTWKRWRSRIGSSSPDWAVMPLIPYGPYELVRGRASRLPTFGDHYFGNDDTGRDVLARMIHGTQTALLMAAGVVFIALLLGVPLGAFAGYYGGWIDVAVSGVIQLFLCFPALFFLLVVMAFLGNSFSGVIVVIGLLSWMSFARIVRGEVIRVRDHEFVRCARGLGIGSMAILFRHILPTVRSQILVNAAFVAATAIVVESTLSFLGLGPTLSTASWGMILREGNLHAASGAWHLWFFPSVVLVGAVMCLHSLASKDSAARAAAERLAPRT